MNRIPPRIRILAERLIAHEAKTRMPSARSATAFEVIEKLRPRLENLMGRAGFHALLSRARTLAMGEAPSVGDLRILADGTLEKPVETQAAAPRGVADERWILLAQLLALLEAFIGELLMLRLIHEAWPKLPPVPAGRGAKHAKK